MRWVWRSLVVLFAAAIVAAASLPNVYAQPAPAPAPAPGPPPVPGPGSPPTLTLGWKQLGMGSTVYFNAANVQQTLTIPVPTGLSPTSISAVLHSATNIAAGYLEATDTDGRLLGSVPIPAGANGETAVPFTINTAAVRPRDEKLQVRLYLRITGGDAICGPPPSLEVSEISANYTGTLPPPTTVQQFFPAIAPAIDLYVDPKPTPAERFTALNLVAALTHHYRPATLNITLRTLGRGQPPPSPGAGIRRAVVIRDAGEPGIAVVTNAPAPYLTLTGKSETLERQAALFRNRLLAVAQTDSVEVKSVQQAPVLGTRTVTFGQIKATGTVEVLGQGSIGLDFSKMPFPLSKPGPIDIHLLANYTPVRDDEKGTLKVDSSGLVLYTAELNTSGRVDARFTIPPEIVARNGGLGLTVSYQPGPGACSPRTVPMTFQVDPASTATLTSGGAVAMGGFSSLPQGFTPFFQVASDDSDPDALNHAAKIVALIQQMSPAELYPQLVGLDEAANSGVGALIIANAESLSRYPLDPPIDTTGDVSDIDVPGPVGANIPDGLATMQAFAQNGRTVVLVTTSGSWELAQPLFTHLAGLEDGWRDLAGDVLVTGEGAQPQTLTIRSDGPTLLAPFPGNQWKVWAWLSAAAIAVAVGLCGFFLVRRRRRRKTVSGGSSP